MSRSVMKSPTSIAGTLREHLNPEQSTRYGIPAAWNSDIPTKSPKLRRIVPAIFCKKTTKGYLKMNKPLVIALITTLAGNTATAQDSTELARNLATLLASDEYCGLSYDQDAIAAFVTRNVPPEDMGFAATLNVMATGTKYMFKGQSGSQKTAYCAAIAQTARKFGFVK